MPAPSAGPHAAPADESALDQLVLAFEQRTLPREHWTHAAHLAVGSHYVFCLGAERAMEEMRHRVRSYNEAVGTANTATSGYHETLTRMWIMILARLLEDHPGQLSRTAYAQVVVERYGHRSGIHKSLYGFDVVKSAEARAYWIEPELPLDSVL
jgi:hypothetical protein